eukprot:11840348-Alexandrium_andersonii.AAC.1
MEALLELQDLLQRLILRERSLLLLRQSCRRAAQRPSRGASPCHGWPSRQGCALAVCRRLVLRVSLS